jgi:multidrug efflux system membrane fusion protein
MKSPGTLEPQTAEPKTRPAPPEVGGASKFPELDAPEGKSSRKYWWVWLLVVAAVAYGCYRLYVVTGQKNEQSASKRAAMMKPRSISVAAAEVRTGDIPLYLQGLGTVTAFNTVAVKTRVDGQLVSVAFQEGQFVNKGDLLAQIDSRPYEVALEQANSALAQAKGNLAKDQAALRDAEANLERYQELFRSQIIAKQQLDTQAATRDQVRGSIAADEAAIATAQAQINSAKLNLIYTHITAPISGRIGLRLVDVGNIVHASDPNGLAVITQLQPIAVLFSIPEEQLPPVLKKLRTGATMRTEAYDRDGKTKIADGTLLTVDNQIDVTTGTSRLKAVFPNTDNSLYPNQFVNVRLSLDVKRNAVIIPTVAIQRGPTGTFVYIVNDDSTASVRPIKIGLTEGNETAVEDGLKPGEQVVVDGAEKLTEGMPVTVHRSGSNNSHRRS